MAAKWPSTVATNADLFVAVNALATTLSGTISDSVTTIPLTSTTGFPTAGAVTIDQEIIFYTGVSGGNLTGCLRHSDGTSAASHTGGVPVSAAHVAFHHNGLMAEIEAIESWLTTNIVANPMTSDLNAGGRSITALAAGSASSPALAFAPGYGIFFDVGTDMKFAINGSPRLQIRESNGDIYCAYPVVGSNTSQTLGSASLYWGKLYTLGIKGTTTNDSASAGDVGQYVESVVTSGSAVTLTDATWTNITSISLTAGDWDVTSLAIFPLNGAGALADFLFAVSAYSGATTTDHVVGDNIITSPVNSTTGINTYAAIPARRFSLASTTTIYMKAFVDVASGAYKGYGRLSARRVR